MPLVIFNYTQRVDNPSNNELDKYTQTLRLPRDAHDKQWRLRSVFGLYHDDLKEDFQVLEVSFPELMKSHNVLMVGKGVDTSEPNECFRFYRNNTSLSAIVKSDFVNHENSCFGLVADHPNFSFGEVKLEEEQVSVVVSARLGSASKRVCKLNSFSIILEYDE